MQLPFDGAISAYFKKGDATETVRDAIRNGRKRAIFMDAILSSFRTDAAQSL